MERIYFIFGLFLLTLAVLLHPSLPTTLKGSEKYSDDHGYLTFLTKFGVQKGHQVYFYGEARRKNTFVGFGSQATLVFIPYSKWKSFYHEVKKYDKCDHLCCEHLINETLRDSYIASTSCIGGNRDFLRQLPCSENHTCENQFPSVSISAHAQFTYHLGDPSDTEYYFAVIMACTNNGTISSCDWAHSNHVEFSYHMHLVNQDPDSDSYNPFIYQFPYNLQSLLLVFITFTSCYYALLAFHIVVNTRLCVDSDYHMHRLVKIFTLSLIFEVVHVSFVLIHLTVYAFDGIGVDALKYLGEASNLISDWLLILVFMLVGKGWQLTTATIRWKKLSFFIWAFYISFSAIYFVWLVISEQVYPYVVSIEHPYQTWAGGLYLAYRLLLFIYILYELWHIYRIENRRFVLIVYWVLFVFYIVWFCYLPAIVLLSLAVNPLERSKVISTTYLFFDLLANAIFVVMFCPKWSGQYFQFSHRINEYSRIHLRMKDQSQGKYGSSEGSPASLRREWSMSIGSTVYKPE